MRPDATTGVVRSAAAGGGPQPRRPPPPHLCGGVSRLRTPAYLTVSVLDAVFETG